MLSQDGVSTLITARVRLRRESKAHYVSPYQALAALIERVGPLERGETGGAAMPFAVHDGADFDSKSLALFEVIAEEQRTARVVLSPASETSYPPAFGRDVMRWIPVVVPLLGASMVFLTGLMWSVVG